MFTKLECTKVRQAKNLWIILHVSASGFYVGNYKCSENIVHYLRNEIFTSLVCIGEYCNSYQNLECHACTVCTNQIAHQNRFNQFSNQMICCVLLIVIFLCCVFANLFVETVMASWRMFDEEQHLVLDFQTKSYVTRIP